MTTKVKMLVRDYLYFFLASWMLLTFLLPETWSPVSMWTPSFYVCAIASGIVSFIFINLPRTKCPKAITALMLLALICFLGSHAVAYFCKIDVGSFNLYPDWLKLLRWILFLIVVGFLVYRISLDCKFSEKSEGA